MLADHLFPVHKRAVRYSIFSLSRLSIILSVVVVVVVVVVAAAAAAADAFDWLL